MSEIQAVSISQYCDIRSSKRVFARDYCDSGVPFYRGKEIIEKFRGALSVSTELFISQEKFAELCAKLGAPQTGDLLLTSVGTLGIPYVVSAGERFYFKDGNLTWFHDFKGLDSTYLYYWLVSPTGKAELAKATIGSSQPAFTIVLLKDLQIACPPLPTQRKIASVLSAYDDLIENNTRRIAILEEMAQAIYREWFVNFRFPGHENVKLVDSPLGMIPEGWLKPLGEVVTLKRGYDLPKKDRRPGMVPIVSSSGVTDYHDTSMVKGPGVVTGRYGTLGKVFYVEEEFWPLNTSLYVREFHGNEPLLVVHLLHSLDLANQNAAGAVPGLNRNALHMIDVVFPPYELQSEIACIIYNIENESRNLRKKNENLRTTRDLLLPRLISGKLDVEDIDIDVGMTAAALEEATA